jgi:sugar lactone lactonase YvrE
MLSSYTIGVVSAETYSYVTQWGDYGSGDGQFLEPNSVAVDASGYVYVVDCHNHRIQKFTSDGVYVTQWGDYGSGDGEFDCPDSVAVDASGYVYVDIKTVNWLT